MEHTIAGSSAAAAVDPDRLVVRHFESLPSSDATSTALPITVVSTDPAGRCVTFSLHNNDHTLGNALRWQLMRYSSEVEFCGYSMPHPSEAKVHLRIQVAESAKGVTAVGLLRRALVDLRELYTEIRKEAANAFSQ